MIKIRHYYVASEMKKEIRAFRYMRNNLSRILEERCALYLVSHWEKRFSFPIRKKSLEAITPPSRIGPFSITRGRPPAEEKCSRRKRRFFPSGG